MITVMMIFIANVLTIIHTNLNIESLIVFSKGRKKNAKLSSEEFQLMSFFGRDRTLCHELCSCFCDDSHLLTFSKTYSSHPFCFGFVSSLLVWVG